MEFLAGFSIGGLVFFLVGLFVGEIMRTRCEADAPPLQHVTPTQGERQLPEYPYHPPVLVIAAPWERTNNVVSMDRPTSALSRR